jgi:hypothetical protein
MESVLEAGNDFRGKLEGTFRGSIGEAASFRR